jgi:signal transduction histidine kinase/CheY-like chemotaxis protein
MSSAVGPDHLVQFFEDEAHLLDTLAPFIAAGLTAGEPGIVVAAPARRERLAGRLRAAGVDVDAARACGAYLELDAAETLARILADGVPDPDRFARVIGPIVETASRERPARVFGEMVGLLASRGSLPAALRLEELWTALQRRHAFRLFCAYPLDRRDGVALAPAIVDICARHSSVLPGGTDHTEAAGGRIGAGELPVEDLRRLHETTARLTGRRDVQSVLRELLDAAMMALEARFGFLSLCDPAHPGLRPGVHAGLDEAFLASVEAIPPPAGAWGTAYAERRRVVVEDVETDAVCAAHREPARRAGVRACHSTPLLARGGEIVGVLSVMFAAPHRPSGREIRLLDLYARIAADSIDNARLHQRLQQELQDRRESLAREHRARAEAERANRMKDEFLATVSHELRTPLNAILGWVHILRGGRTEEATVGRGLDVIERNAQTQAQLITDLLDASRVLAGGVRLGRGPVDLAAVVQAAVEAVRLAAETKAIQLDVTIDPGARRLRGDAGRLQQVMWNLLANAVKFTSPGGRVDVRVERADDRARVSVTDTGEGVALEFLPFIFDGFRQADSTITRRHGGLGLGLAIVRHLVELHGGTVEARSAGEGYGASFVVELPMATPGGDAPGVREAGGPALPGVQILVVDDDQDALDLLTLVLTEAGAAVRTAGSTAEALALLRWIQPDVVISDLAMPDEDGYSLVRSLRAMERGRGRETPAVALTAYVRVQDRARAVAAGFDVFVEKPVDPGELVAVLAGIAGARGPARERANPGSAPA